MRHCLLLALLLSQAPVLPVLDPESIGAIPAPFGAVQGGVAVLEGRVGSDGTLRDLRFAGGAPDLASYLSDGVRGWRFVVAPNVELGPVSITALFRPTTMFPIGDAARAVRAEAATPASAPPLPTEIVDPGYPPLSVAEGTVVLELRIDASGAIEEIRVTHGVASLTDAAVDGVRQWQFRPARSGGRPVEGRAIAMISFRRP